MEAEIKPVNIYIPLETPKKKKKKKKEEKKKERGKFKSEHKINKKKLGENKNKNHTLRAGFEPAREDPIGFQVQRLNHSAIAAGCVSLKTSKIKV